MFYGIRRFIVARYFLNILCDNRFLRPKNKENYYGFRGWISCFSEIELDAASFLLVVQIS